jgi:16S rRNA (adenine1518-N6/adenine1519-N6)-dimethyltransferase
MLQREVAERVCAEPGSRAYGSLSVLVALYAVARLAFSVPPLAFRPPPKVHSAVARLDVSVEPRIETDPITFRRVVRAAFAQRRKTLRNALAAAFGGGLAEAVLTGAGIEASRRAETLSLEEFARLAAEVKVRA